MFSFWSKKTPPEAAPAAPSAPDGEREWARAEADLDASLDGAAGVLRAIAKHSFPVGDEPGASIAKRFEEWAAHILTLAPLPDAPGERPKRRDWASLVRFVEAHRKQEQEHVHGSITTMREAMVGMLRCFGAASVGQVRSEAVVTEHLERLRATVETGSFVQLRAEALAVAQAVAAALAEQTQRTREQTTELRTKLSALRQQLDEAEHDRETDSLTKLFNRRAFDTSMERTSVLANAMGRPMSLLVIDIDHFKQINDRYGHPGGDQVLKALADVLTRSFPRRSDLVARYGGEEFAVVLGDTGAHDAARLAQRFLVAVRAMRVAIGERVVGLTASVGVGELLEGESAAELLARTDAALYRAKSSGRDRAVDADATQSDIERTTRPATITTTIVTTATPTNTRIRLPGCA
jgi:diguanylate cyclase (GGDEF)-like protein